MNDLTSDDYRQLAEIMSGPHGAPVTPENPVNVLIVFCCGDPIVGKTAATLYHEGMVEKIIFSGDVGKDSGPLAELEIREAVFQASIAIGKGLPPEAVILERFARNGRENARNSLLLADMRQLLTPDCNIASLAPAQRSRRLHQELLYQVDHYTPIGGVYGLSSGTIDTTDPAIQAELFQELCGLQRMHLGDSPRIHPQYDFLEGGKYRHLVVKAGIADQ